jgi:hypothetical protein
VKVTIEELAVAVVVLHFSSLWILSSNSRKGGSEAKISRFHSTQREQLASGEIASHHRFSKDRIFHFRGSKIGVEIPGSRFMNFLRFLL